MNCVIELILTYDELMDTPKSFSMRLDVMYLCVCKLKHNKVIIRIKITSKVIDTYLCKNYDIFEAIFVFVNTFVIKLIIL